MVKETGDAGESHKIPVINVSWESPSCWSNAPATTKVHAVESKGNQHNFKGFGTVRPHFLYATPKMGLSEEEF